MMIVICVYMAVREIAGDGDADSRIRCLSYNFFFMNQSLGPGHLYESIDF